MSGDEQGPGPPPLRPRLDEAEALALAQEAIDEVGGSRMIYRNPRYAFSMQATRVVTVRGVPVEVRWGEISSPAVASVGGYVFEILDEEISLLIRPPRPRPDPSPGAG
ncbi:MAG: hypothetical protein H0U40_03055 [Chloroflexia bacterium]|nr:hypothetical protein [Chloroflexia bacterium]